MSSPGQAATMGTTLVHLFRTLRAARRELPRVHPAVDPMSYPVLYAVAGEPVRVSAVAHRAFSDISTVSRQVSALAAHGLIEKSPDPEDGRAQLLSLSPAGRDLLERLNAQRNEWFASLVQDWDPQDLRDFTGHLQRFAAAVETRDRTSVPR